MVKILQGVTPKHQNKPRVSYLCLWKHLICFKSDECFPIFHLCRWDLLGIRQLTLWLLWERDCSHCQKKASVSCRWRLPPLGSNTLIHHDFSLYFHHLRFWEATIVFEENVRTVCIWQIKCAFWWKGGSKGVRYRKYIIFRHLCKVLWVFRVCSGPQICVVVREEITAQCSSSNYMQAAKM